MTSLTESLKNVRIEKLTCVNLIQVFDIEHPFEDHTVFLNGDKKSSDIIPDNIHNNDSRTITDIAIFNI